MIELSEIEILMGRSLTNIERMIFDKYKTNPNFYFLNENGLLKVKRK